MKSFKKHNEKIEVSQDKDIDDREGSQPATFQKGIKSKATKTARDIHFKKMSKADDSDPSAYKDAPGDKKARAAGTKESPYTKKFKKMYGESADLAEDANATLKDKADKGGYSLAILKQVYKRGMAAWKTGHKPGTNPQQWGMARVNSFMTGGRTRVKGDPDLWAKQKGKIKKGKTTKEEVNEDAPCWDTHKQVGTKVKKGKEVPNCVPKNEAADGPTLPHMMYDPKTGKEYTAKTADDHNRMKKLGYSHEKPVEEHCDCGETPCKHKKTDVAEAMDMAQRRKAAINFKRNKSKIKIGRERAKRRMASKEVLMKRARKAARMTIMKKLTKVGSKSDLDFARRQAIEKRLDKMGPKIDQVAKKLFPALRKKEMTKRQAKPEVKPK